MGQKKIFCDFRLGKGPSINYVVSKSAIFDSLPPSLVSTNWYVLVLAFSPGLFPFSVPGLLDFFSPGTTGPRDLQGL